VCIYACIFTGAGLLTLVFRKTNWGRNITAAILMWLVIFVLFVGTSFAGWIPFCVLIMLISYGAIREFYKINGVFTRLSMLMASVMLLMMALALGFEQKFLFYCVPGLAVLLLVPIHMFKNSYEQITRSVSIQLFGITYWGWLMMHFLLLRRLECGFGAILVLATMIALNDNSAYYFGKLLGKNSRKMSPRISPGKTWVGFCGGCFASILAVFAFSYALPPLAVHYRIILGVVIALSIPFGDLVESAMKRDAGVKDSGNIIPGHGGVMDRFDSWAFTAPVVYYSLIILELIKA
jgi:phosphatidate cytidylyltransferase